VNRFMGKTSFKKFSPYPFQELSQQFLFFLGKLLEKFSQTLSKLSQHFYCVRVFIFCRTLGTAVSFQVPPP